MAPLSKVEDGSSPVHLPAWKLVGVHKYLERWAEPEARRNWDALGSYHAALVVPALGEEPTLLDGFRAAAAQAPGRILLVLVVNASPTTPAPLRAASRALFDVLSARGVPLEPGAALVHEPQLDVLLLDRASPGRELPERQGVGLARKIGMDVGLALFSRKQLLWPFLFSTDADAELASDYFQLAEGFSGAGASAMIYPFEHIAFEDAATHQATCLYELKLRYHVLGLAWAGSAYAYHALGSALAVNCLAYAAVRGVPKRAAGEDFYLLDKLAKLDPILKLRGSPVRIRSRRSERAPFGTGREVDALLRGGSLTVASPLAFRALRAVLQSLDAFAKTRDEAEFGPAVQSLGKTAEPKLERVLRESGLVAAAKSAASEVGSGSLRRRLSTWFDALRTLRFLHALRDAELPELPLLQALKCAPFIDRVLEESPEAWLLQLRNLERGLPERTGPSLF